MWYVNETYVVAKMNITDSFILTMWYVNLTGVELKDFLLYINYMVCKCLYVHLGLYVLY